jgi:quinol-cytochrome oxidoreductase complex cytochrome b subunit
LLGIFSFVIAGLGVFGLIFLGLHYLLMSTMLNNPEMWKKMQEQPNAPPFDPMQFFNAFRYIYLFIGAWGFASIICNAIAGFCLLNQRDRMFCMIIAGFNCINFPFGTALGIFTLLVLLRDSVRLKFEGDASA